MVIDCNFSVRYTNDDIKKLLVYIKEKMIEILKFLLFENDNIKVLSDVSQIEIGLDDLNFINSIDFE